MFTLTSMSRTTSAASCRCLRSLRDSANRAARWAFRKLDTLRHVILRAGRLTPPEGKLTLTMNGNATVRDDVLRYVKAARAA